MLGTIINSVAIFAGGFFGLLIKGGLKEKYRDIIMQALGLSVLFTGAASALETMINKNSEPILFIISLVLGSTIGTFFDIEGKLQGFGDFLQKHIGNNNDSNISNGFVTASLMFCVGSMAILGSLESGIKGQHTTLFVKAVLDGTSAIIFASTMGIGVLISGISVLLYQGTLTLFSSFIQPYLTENMLNEISVVGGIMIFALSLNLLEIKKIKVGNMLPSLVIPVVYYIPFVHNLFNTLKLT